MLTIAHISGEKLPKRQLSQISKKEQLHRDAVALVAEQTVKDRIKAKKMFTAEREEIKELEKQLAALWKL